MNREPRLDMTMMYAIHDALRRELERLARTVATTAGDPRRSVADAVGWDLFKRFLEAHHTSEDVTVWPVVRQAVDGRPSDIALLDAMEAEHAVIDPLLARIDRSLLDPEAGADELPGLVDMLCTELSGHLKHEEDEALRLMDATMTQEQWQAFSTEQRARIGDLSSRYLPWLLDSAGAEQSEAILSRMPPPLVAVYESEWRKAYEALDLWGSADGSAAR
jgi:hypothetical protein